MIALDIDPGDSYDPQQVRMRFRALWDLGLFEDITVETETGAAGGTVLIFKVAERPRLASLTYEENSVVTRTQIEDAYNMGCVAVGATIYFGSDDSNRQIIEVAEAFSRAKENGRRIHVMQLFGTFDDESC